MSGFEIKRSDGEPFDPDTQRVMDAIAAAMDELVVGRSLAETVHDWNEKPLQQRKEIAARLMGLPTPGDEVSQVSFDFRGKPFDPNVEIVVNITMARAIEQVHMTVTVGEEREPCDYCKAKGREWTPECEENKHPDGHPATEGEAP